MKPSDIVEVYRSATRAARRIGQEFRIDEKRLEPMFSQRQIDAIFAEIENVEAMENQYQARLVALDGLPASSE